MIIETRTMGGCRDRVVAEAATEASGAYRRAGMGWNKHDDAYLMSVVGAAAQRGAPSVLHKWGALRTSSRGAVIWGWDGRVDGVCAPLASWRSVRRRRWPRSAARACGTRVGRWRSGAADLHVGRGVRERV